MVLYPSSEQCDGMPLLPSIHWLAALHQGLRPIVTGTAFVVILLGGSGGIVLAQTPDALAPGASPDATLPAETTGIFAEPPAIERAVELARRVRFLANGDGGEGKTGLYPELSNMVTGAGWISGGPGYRQWLFGDRLFLDGSAAISWRAYQMAQARAEFTNLARSRIAVGSQVRWQDLTQVTYFGEGPDSVESDRSEYRLQATNVVGYVTFRPARSLSINGRVGWISRPWVSSPAGTFERGNPSTQDVFPDDPVFAVTQQPAYTYHDLSVALDTRNHQNRPTRGGVYRAGWVGYSAQDDGPFSFGRSEIEGAHFVPLAGSRVVLAAHGWVVASSLRDDQTVPFYLLPGLGGNNTLRSYNDYRFHDRNLLLASVEARVALFTHVDAAGFVDAGNVAHRFSELNLDRTSIGVGLRMHRSGTTFARFDVAHGNEGWGFVFRMHDSLQLTRVARRTAAVPLVP